MDLDKDTRRRSVLLGSLGALASVALTACGLGRSETAPKAPPVAGGTLGLGIVGLFVKDLDASLAFYRRLGLAIPTDVDTSGGAFRLRLPSGQIFFWETVAYVRGFDPTYEQGTGDRKVNLEFGFATLEDVNAMYDALLAAGARSYLPPITWSKGTIRYAIVVDPDANQISLRWPLTS